MDAGAQGGAPAKFLEGYVDPEADEEGIEITNSSASTSTSTNTDAPEIIECFWSEKLQKKRVNCLLFSFLP